MVRQGTELKKRKKRLPIPHHPERDHYRDLVLQNEWLQANVFDAMGNYLFCQECIVKALHVSKQRLARQRAIKRDTVQSNIKTLKKSEVDEKNLKLSVVMPIGHSQSLNSWWKTLAPDDEVSVRFPHGRHGLSGKTSNNAKFVAKTEFLEFIDQNSQPNGRRLDSKNPTFYFLPKFTSITVPKKSDPNYQSKLHSSITAEFNRSQTD